MPSSNLEQFLLELINDARLDPFGNAARYISSYTPLTSPDANIQGALNFFQVNGAALQSAFAALTPVEPLAFNDSLASAARTHNNAMIAANSQSHQLPGEQDAGARMAAAGYAPADTFGWGENIFAKSSGVLEEHAGFMVDWGSGPNGMQSPPGHRQNIMSSDFREIGVGITQAAVQSNTGPLTVTEDFASRGAAGVFVLGVAFNDTDQDKFYTPGEGLGGLTVSVGASSTSSSASGGYSLQSSATGPQTITLTGAGLTAAATMTTNLANGHNYKLDIVDGNTLRTSVSGTVSGPVSTVQALGITGLTLTTGAGAQTLIGNKGNDSLDGGADLDRAVFTGAFASYTLTALAGNSVRVIGPDGTDTLSNIEQLKFSDQTITWPPASSDDQTFTVGGGSQRFDGGSGVDTVIFNFALTSAAISWSGNQVVVDTPSSHTVLTGIERFAFSDGTVDNNDGSPLIDDLYYYSKNQDVWNAHVDADAHYNQFGWRELRDPDAFFSTTFYLALNQDVKAAGINPLTHFDQAGWKEGRLPSAAFDSAKYLQANSDVAAARIDPLAHFLQAGAAEGRQPFAKISLLSSDGFDAIFYLQQYQDVQRAEIDPHQHYLQFGWKEGRNPNAFFDDGGYLANYIDVKNVGINPLLHFHQFGWTEGRDPSKAFDTTSYLAAYADVQALHIDPLLHFLQFGMAEGRSAFGDGVWG